MENTDTAEDFVSLQGHNAALDQMFVKPAKTFQGQALAPYGEGAKILLGTAASGPLGTKHWLMIMVFLLIDLQAAFDKYKKGEPPRVPPMNDDDATDAATADIIRAIGDDLATYQARAIGRAARLGKKGIEEASKIAMEIFKQSQDTELIPTEEASAESEPGK